MINLLRKLFPTATAALRGEGYQAAIKDILVSKDKIYTGPVTLPGNKKTVKNCTFLGGTVGLKIVVKRNKRRSNAVHERQSKRAKPACECPPRCTC